MIVIGNRIYTLDVTGDWICRGEIVKGFDGEYIQWFI